MRRKLRFAALVIAALGLHAALVAAAFGAHAPTRERQGDVVVLLARVVERPAPLESPDSDVKAAPTSTPQTPPSKASTPIALGNSVAVEAATVDAPDEYVAAANLSERPAPQRDIEVPYPDESALQEPLVILLTLFIDEKGVVQRAISDDGIAVPHHFVEAARAAFMSADFTPGRVDHIPVKTKLRVEVTFDPRERLLVD